MPERVFFALWPDEATRWRLEAVSKLLHRCCDGKVTRPESIHLTLAFLGEVEDSQPLCAIASKISANSFEINIDRAGYWKHNRIAWAGTSEIPSALAELEKKLRTALEASGYLLEKRPFLPHVTLLRRGFAPKTLPGFEPFQWSVSAFCLVRSSDGGYEILEKWPLI
ncbi:MAG: RNA 2',3'-cyclic phosphodiesterase [Burkholderiales bacterium]|nr:RNA 2',3'-cyclic phosphodiesterase [Burkholderiales bacterium]